MVERVGLVACGSSKLDHAAPARELYTGRLFVLSAEWARRRCSRWFILSAKYGLLDPERVVEPYNLTLNTMRPAEVENWGRWVAGQLRAKVPEAAVLVLLAGQRYGAFRPFLHKPVEEPLAGLPIGFRLQRLNRDLGG